MRRFLLLWFVLASSFGVAALLIDFFSGSRSTSRIDFAVTLAAVTLVQSAVLHFARPHPHASPDQHR